MKIGEATWKTEKQVLMRRKVRGFACVLVVTLFFLYNTTFSFSYTITIIILLLS